MSQEEAREIQEMMRNMRQQIKSAKEDMAIANKKTQSLEIGTLLCVCSTMPLSVVIYGSINIKLTYSHIKFVYLIIVDREKRV